LFQGRIDDCPAAQVGGAWVLWTNGAIARVAEFLNVFNRLCLANPTPISSITQSLGSADHPKHGRPAKVGLRLREHV